jgi:hypothetical protein
MKRSLLIRIKEWCARKSSTAWACFETGGIEDDGRLEFSVSWNKAFANNLRSKGYDGATEEEMVNLFFLSTRMLPEYLLDEQDNVVNPEAMPRLTSESTRLMR